MGMAGDIKNLRQRTDLRITFLHIVMFFTLWAWIVAVNSILRRSIDLHFPVPRSSAYEAAASAISHITNRISHTVLSFELIALLIFFPCFLFTRAALAKAVAENSQVLNSGTRRRLLYISLFLSAAAIVVTIFFAVSLLFAGTFTTNFSLKTVVLFTLMGSLFGILRFPKRDVIFSFLFCASACIGLVVGFMDLCQTQAAAGTPADEAADRIAAANLVALMVRAPRLHTSGDGKMPVHRTASKAMVFFDKKSLKLLKGAWTLKKVASGSVRFRNRPNCRHAIKIIVRGLRFSIAADGLKASFAPLRVREADSARACPFSASPQRDILFDLTSLRAKGKSIAMTFAERSGGWSRLHAIFHTTLSKGRILSGRILFKQYVHGTISWRIPIMLTIVQGHVQRRIGLSAKAQPARGTRAVAHNPLRQGIPQGIEGGARRR
jgi:Domain of unknown function (DUF5671)